MNARLVRWIVSLACAVAVLVSAPPFAVAATRKPPKLPVRSAMQARSAQVAAAQATFCDETKAVRAQRASAAGAAKPAVVFTSLSPRAQDAARVMGAPATCLANAAADCGAEVDALCVPGFHAEAGAAPSAAAASVGAGWQAALVNGLASYLGQRAQQEVVLWLESDIVQQLCHRSYRVGSVTFEGSRLFPATCAIQDPTTPNIGTVFAAALRQDLEGLPLQFAVGVLGIDASLATDIVSRLRMLQQGQPPLEVLGGLASTSPPSAEYALCSAARPPPPAPQLSASTGLACSLVAVGVLVEWGGDAQTSAQNLEREISGLSPQTDVVASFVEFVNSTCDALQHACVLRPLDAKADRDAVANLLRKLQAIYTIVSTPTSGSTADLASRGGQLIGAVVAAIDAGAPFLDTDAKSHFDSAWAGIEPALDATAEALQGQTAAAVSDALKALADFLRQESQGKDGLQQALVATVSLAADLAAAQTAQDVQTALEAAAAPLGSWRSKHQVFSVTLNAYVGGAFGYEAPAQPASSALPGNWAGGAFAPVGIDVTIPTGAGWAVGTFISAIDVGQLLTSPIDAKTGTTTGTQTGKTAVAGGDVTLVQVLSPGLYLHTSFGNTPVTLGAGVSVAPLLRYYQDEGGANKTPFSMARINGFLAVDLELIPLYTAHDTQGAAPSTASAGSPAASH